MTYQLVLSGNRILAHGEADCFLSMGGTVICEETGKAYQNATVVTHEGSLPSDIDTVGYEYHAGVFVPCAPYGKGTGEIMVACDECGTPKRSGYKSALLGDTAELLESKGQAGGVAMLDENSKIPFANIPTSELSSALLVRHLETKTYSPTSDQAYAAAMGTTVAITSTFEIGNLIEFWFVVAPAYCGSGGSDSTVTFIGADGSAVYNYSGNFGANTAGFVTHGVRVGDTSKGFWVVEHTSGTSFSTKSIQKTISTPVSEITIVDNTAAKAGTTKTTTLTLYGVLGGDE